MIENFYFGHHKCGTNWIRRTLRDLCRRREWNYEVNGGTNNPLRFAHATRRMNLFVNSSPIRLKKMPKASLGFHLIRDPRDAMVSGYWSWKNSHQNNTPEILATREVLRQLNVEDGLIEMLDHIPLIIETKDWNFGGYENVLEVRYEELVSEPLSGFRQIFDFLEVAISDEELAALVDAHSFSRITGRAVGHEDTNSHLRKGIAGDWKNYFTDRIKSLFKEKHGDVLISMGYEDGNDW